MGVRCSQIATVSITILPQQLSESQAHKVCISYIHIYTLGIDTQMSYSWDTQWKSYAQIDQIIKLDEKNT